MGYDLIKNDILIFKIGKSSRLLVPVIRHAVFIHNGDVILPIPRGFKDTKALSGFQCTGFEKFPLMRPIRIYLSSLISLYKILYQARIIPGLLSVTSPIIVASATPAPFNCETRVLASPEGREKISPPEVWGSYNSPWSTWVSSF